ncbi:MAG: dioxygenase [Myxococcota bacterium]
MPRMPAIFVSHGAPPALEDAAWMAEWRAWGLALPRPRAVLVVSAHWEERPVTIGATRTLPLVYDFYGFPERYYTFQWPAPGAPELADRVRALARAAGVAVADDPERGLDHGVYVPFAAMWPEADVPVLQVSIPSLDPRALLDMGRWLAPLRDEGVLVAGSGFMTHNLRMLGTPGVAAWAREFDDWATRTLAAGDLDALADFDRKAPAARIAHPRTEHFVPLLIAAAAAPGEAATFPVTGFAWGPFSKRSVQFGGVS